MGRDRDTFRLEDRSHVRDAIDRPLTGETAQSQSRPEADHQPTSMKQTFECGMLLLPQTLPSSHFLGTQFVGHLTN